MWKSARTAFFLAFIGFCASGAAASISCAAPEYIGGSCGDDGFGCERIGGTTCINNVCECPAGEQKCCGGGFGTDGNPLGCLKEGDYRCRAISLCDVVVPVPTTTTTQDAGPPPDAEPPPPEPECHEDTVLEDCPPVVEPRCSAPLCDEGACAVSLQTSIAPINWQYPGDCRAAYCVAGGVVLQQDPNDVPIFADPCVKDSCDVNGIPQREAVPIGSPCIDAPGFCLEVQTSSGPAVRCVECDAFNPAMNDCPIGLGCHQNRCVPPGCFDLIANNGETDVDCGGPTQCARCPISASCDNDEDCVDNKCEGPMGAKSCAAPTHDDGKKNDGETGVDCGCSQCAKLCDTDEGCTGAASCTSGVCYGGKCLAPSCFDYVKNGDEVDVDCGGSCALPCPPPGK